MQEIGKQYTAEDNREDTTGFKSAARLHQSKFRAQELKLPYDTYGNFLKKEDGEMGKNFYSGFNEIFDAVRNYRDYNKPLYSNMLRSEHIPFNFFVPFRKDTIFCKNVFNSLMGNCIKSIDRQAIIDGKENIKIEFAPKPKKDFLNDGTSFDAYIEYTHIDNSKGIIGIEVKYTEKEYELSGETEEKAINNLQSPYFIISDKSKLYKPSNFDKLKSNEFRQVWRNHLLGESILHSKLNEQTNFKHFSSLTFFPIRNLHFVETSKKYIDLLRNNNKNFLPITYEEFFMWCYYHCPNDKFKKWIDYLTERYIVIND